MPEVLPTGDGPARRVRSLQGERASVQALQEHKLRAPRRLHMRNECGHSRHARVEISIAAKPAGSYPRVLTEEDAARAVSDLETESASAARARATVNSLRNQLRKMLESAPGEGRG